MSWTWYLNKDEMVELCIKHDVEKDWTYGLSREYLKEHAQDWFSINEMLKNKCPEYSPPNGRLSSLVLLCV